MNARARIFALLVVGLLSGGQAWATGNLEIPQPGSTQSGVGIVSGWFCSASLIEISFDGGARTKAAYGTTRGDTVGICGDDNNGFSLLWSYSLLHAGTHVAVAYADGVEFGRSSFTITDIADGGFLTGVEGETRIKGFPDTSSDLILRWQEANQNFVIADQVPSADPFDMAGVWSVEGEPGAIVSINILAQEAGVARFVLHYSDLNSDLILVFLGSVSGANGTIETTSDLNNVGGSETDSFTFLSKNQVRFITTSCSPSSLCTPGEVTTIDRLVP